ncbi:MAG: FAD-dependent monooxygenase, partial [Myxococcota bacterium]|nr:FAD-dependent monooxygenase [Myxococcota bacterium]
WFRGGAPPTTVSQPHLLERLVTKASEHRSFRFVRGGRVTDLVDEGGRIAGVRLREDGAESDETLRASLVVGADGRTSIVRRKGGFQAVDLHAPMDVAWCKLPWPDAWKGERRVQAHVAGGHLLIALPAPDGQLQLAWVLLKGTFAEVRSRGIEAWVEDMAEHVTPDLAAHLRAHGGSIQRPFLLSAATDHVTRWTRPGVLLIGDAAHTMSPVGGQGLNVALRDAVVAANHLVPVLREGGTAAALDAAAERVAAERRPEIEEIQALAAMPPRLGLRGGAVAGVLRSVLARLIQLPPVQARALRVVDKFLYGTRRVELCV